jgi:hypothetical protein
MSHYLSPQDISLAELKTRNDKDDLALKKRKSSIIKTLENNDKLAIIS